MLMFMLAHILGFIFYLSLTLIDSPEYLRSPVDIARLFDVSTLHITFDFVKQQLSRDKHPIARSYGVELLGHQLTHVENAARLSRLVGRLLENPINFHVNDEANELRRTILVHMVLNVTETNEKFLDFLDPSSIRKHVNYASQIAPRRLIAIDLLDFLDDIANLTSHHRKVDATALQ